MKIMLLGDSITQGLGSKKVNFVEQLQQLLPHAAILNWAQTGTTVKHAVELVPQILHEKPDVVCILYGNVDAQLKPNRKGKIFKHLPRRFQGGNGSMILPRPFYSSKWYKRWPQKVENRLRSLFRMLIYKIDGTEQWTTRTDFQRDYAQLCARLCRENIRILACSTVYIDECLFPGTPAQYRSYNQVIKQIASELHIPFINLYALFEQEVTARGWSKIYNFDHFHPNGNGYKLLAGWLAEKLLENNHVTH